jgi:hypothetical protein
MFNGVILLLLEFVFYVFYHYETFVGVLFVWCNNTVRNIIYILVLECIGCVEPNRVVTITSKTMAKLRFGIVTMP